MEALPTEAPHTITIRTALYAKALCMTLYTALYTEALRMEALYIEALHTITLRTGLYTEALRTIALFVEAPHATLYNNFNLVC